MNPFFFGPSDNPLYGVLHPADGASFRDECVVLCNPFGQEYERAHRAFKIIATNLARLGYEVLRFDYNGTGDSGGDGATISLRQWRNNILTAVAEVKECSGSEAVSLVGLRLGATLALDASADVEHLVRCVCWDPILDAASYNEEIRHYLEPEYLPALDNPDADLYLNGYPLPASFRRELGSISLAGARLGDADYVVLSSHQSEACSQTFNELAKQSPRCSYKVVECESDWNHLDEFGGILIPQPIISAITEIFAQASQK